MMDILDTLHPDIAAAEREYPHGPIVEVIDPSSGIWGGDPKPGLVTLVYTCIDDGCSPFANRPGHTHRALYGPVIVHFPDDCATCGESKYRSHAGHDYAERGDEVLDREHFALYAD